MNQITEITEITNVKPTGKTLIITWAIILTAIVWMLWTNTAKTQEALGDQTLTFYLEPPEPVVPWTIKSVHLPDHSDFQNEIMQYAYITSGYDKEFLYMLKAECGRIDPKCKGDEGHAHGVCQIHDLYHSKIIKDPRFKDWKWQVNQCVRLWQGGTKFYGYKNRNKVTKYFNFIP